MSSSKRKHSSEEDDDSTNCYGPSLPSHLGKNTSYDSISVNEDSSPRKKPPSAIIGPVLPPHLQKQSENTNYSDNSDSDSQDNHRSDLKPNVIGPVIPSDLANIKKKEPTSQLPSDSFGPALPPNFKKSNRDSSNSSKDPQSPNKGAKVLGPSLPPRLLTLSEHDNPESSEDDDDAFGPLPPDASRLSGAHIALEERALHMKMDQLGPDKDQPIVREEWMLELPEVKAAKFGLGPRQFRSKAGPDMSDRSSWTKVAGKSKTVDKETKVDMKKEAELRELERRDKEQEKMAKKHKRKEKSLMETHQDELNKKKKEEGPTERRPFSRDVDLQVNRFDEAQKKAVLKKAQLLDDRFSSGKSKFL